MLGVVHLTADAGYDPGANVNRQPGKDQLVSHWTLLNISQLIRGLL